MTEVALLRPFWLLALAPIAGLWLLLRRRRAGTGDWAKAVDPALMAAMAALGRVDGGTGRAAARAALAAAALVVVALSGPAAERRESLSFRNLDGAIFVVDASRSVTEAPGWPALQTMGRFAIAGLGARPGALVVYAGDAYVATDMTLDHGELGQTFSLIDGETAPDPGSRPERALALAADLLEAGEVLAGDVILMTDGGGLGPPSRAAAAEIARRGARLSLVTLGAQTSGAAAEAAAHAEAGGGRLFAAEDVEAMTAWLADDARTRLERQDFPLLFWKDFGRYALILALIPLLLLFRREAA